MDKFEKNAYWKILQNRDTNELIFIPPSTAGASRINQKDLQHYDEVGYLRDGDDAASFLEFKEMDLSPDAIEFLKCEHDVNERINSGITDYDRGELAKLVADVRRDTGRACFGTCRSFDKEKACETCYLHKHATWLICATAKCVDMYDAKRKAE